MNAIRAHLPTFCRFLHDDRRQHLKHHCCRQPEGAYRRDDFATSTRDTAAVGSHLFLIFKILIVGISSMFQNEYLAKSVEMFTKIPIVTRRGSLLRVALMELFAETFSGPITIKLY